MKDDPSDGEMVVYYITRPNPTPGVHFRFQHHHVRVAVPLTLTPSLVPPSAMDDESAEIELVRFITTPNI